MASGLGNAIGDDDMQVSTRQKTTAVWKQLIISRLFSGAMVHAPFNEFGAMLQTDRFRFLSVIAFSYICTFRYFARAVQDRSDGLSGIIFPHRFCDAAPWETSLFVIASLVAKFAASEKVPLLNDCICGSFFILDRSLVGRPHLTYTVVNVLTSQAQYHLFNWR